MEVLNNIMLFIISGFTFIVCMWASVLWGRNKGLNDELSKIREEKWKKDIDDIRRRYSDSSIQSIVDQSNKEWKSRRTDDESP